MKYKTKLIFLFSIIFACVIILFAGFIFDPQNMNARTSMYTWLDKSWIDQADRILIKASGGSESISLIRKYNIWYVLVNDIEYPATQERVNDLFSLLTARSSYSVRASSPSSHERLGVTEQLASRIVVYGGASAIPLLDLLIGSGNSAGNEIYLRKNGNNEVRSGEDQFTPYSDAKQNAWFDLRLFENNEQLRVGMVQQVTINKNIPEQELSFSLSRTYDGEQTSWNINSSPNMILDNTRAESFVRTLLSSEAVDFAVNALPSDYDFSYGKIELLLDDLSRINIVVASALENGQYPAMAGGKPFVYLIPQWLLDRMFRETEYFAAGEAS